MCPAPPLLPPPATCGTAISSCELLPWHPVATTVQGGVSIKWGFGRTSIFWADAPHLCPGLCSAVVSAHAVVTGFCVAGGRIVSSKPFAPLNFRINSRNLSGKHCAQQCTGGLASLSQSDGAPPCCSQPLSIRTHTCPFSFMMLQEEVVTLKKGLGVQIPAVVAGRPVGCNSGPAQGLHACFDTG